MIVADAAFSPGRLLTWSAGRTAASTADRMPSGPVIETFGQGHVLGQEIRAQPEQNRPRQEALDDALIDLLATVIAPSGEQRSAGRHSLARHIVIADSLWSD
jgi:hypothetical protein